MPVYDGNGNLANDTYYTYAWDADGHMIQIDGLTAAYDALGRRVEDTGSGVAYDFLYNMDGSKLAVFQCCSLNYLKLSLPLPGGGSAVYNWSGLSYYRHPDWLGTTRLATSPGRASQYLRNDEHDVSGAANPGRRRPSGPAQEAAEKLPLSNQASMDKKRRSVTRQKPKPPERVFSAASQSR